VSARAERQSADSFWSLAFCDPSDIIGTTVGGNSYGWFVQNEFDGLAIDNSFRTGAMSTSGCTVKISDGGRITASNGDTATFGGNAKASASGSTSGEQTYQDHGPAQPLTVNRKQRRSTLLLSTVDSMPFLMLCSSNSRKEVV